MKTVVITGVSSGIGKAFAEILLKEKNSYKVIGISRREMLLEGMKFYKCDLMNLKEVENVAKKIFEENENVDVLVNNAGVGFPTKLDELSEEDYDEIMSTNVKGLIFLSKFFLKGMKERNLGHIVNVSSSAGIQSNPVAPIYCTSKHALEGYTNGLRMQLKEEGKNIRVSNVRPGGVDSEYWRNRDVPREKFMTPEEMATVLKFVIDFPSSSNVVDITMESVR